MKAMKQAVLSTAQNLVKANNTVTTLEIKTELRRDYPYYYWDQDTVSKYMDQFAGDGMFTYTDNGTYRTYSLVKVQNTKKLLTPTYTSTMTTNYSNVTPVQVKISQKITNSNPKLPRTKKIDKNVTLLLTHHVNFESVTLNNGKVVNKHIIKSQKKSPWGYITPKINRINAITVGGTTYKVI